MRISDLELAEFRCFRHGVLDLSADVTAIYGRNGSGKTAIFDGIELALFGEVQRLGRAAEARSALRNVYAENETFIRLGFVNTTKTSLKTRIGEDGTSYLVDSLWPAHRDFLYQHFINSKFFPPRQEVSRVEQMFRASLLLSQENLHEFVHGGPEARAAVLATLAGAGFLQRCKDRAAEVVSEARRRRGRIAADIELAGSRHADLKRQLEDRKARVEELARELGGGGVSAPHLARLLHEAGLGASAASIPNEAQAAEDFAARVSAICDERLRSVSARAARLEEIGRGLRDQEARVGQARGAQERLVALRGAQVEASEKLEALREQRRRLADQLSALERRGQQLADAVEAGSSLERLGPELESTEAELRALEDRRTLAMGQDDELARTEQELESSARAADAAVEQQRVQTRRRRERLELLLSLKSGFAEFEAAGEEVQEISDALQVDQSVLPRLEELDQEIGRLRREIISANSELEQRRRERGEQERIVAQLLALVSGTECPACGTEHSSEEVLRERIVERLGRGGEELSELIDRAGSLERRTRELEEERRLKQLERNRLESQRKEKEQRRLQLVQQREEFKNRVLDHLVEATREVLEISLSEARALVEVSEAAIAELRAEAERAHAALEAGRRERAAADASNRTVASEIERQAEKARQLRERLAEARRRADVPALPQDDADSELGAMLQANNMQRAELEAELQSVEEAVAERTRLAATLGREEGELAGVARELAGKIEAFRDSCVAAGVSRFASSGSITEANREVEQARSALQKARTLAVGYARGLRLTSLRNERVSIDQTTREAEGRLNALESDALALEEAQRVVQGWLEALATEVGATTQVAADEHMNSIQKYFKALTPVPHAFENVELRYAAGETLHLGIRYRDLEESSGEPKYYLSKAQANVLAIAIFLSFGLAANWSRLDALLLDDPVQHLDDLDAASFLDTIRAAALGRFGPRKQIVVSTCNRTLYLLMLRKFSRVPANQLSFSAISLVDRGPKGPEIVYDVGGPNQTMPDW